MFKNMQSEIFKCNLQSNQYLRKCLPVRRRRREVQRSRKCKQYLKIELKHSYIPVKFLFGTIIIFLKSVSVTLVSSLLDRDLRQKQKITLLSQTQLTFISLYPVHVCLPACLPACVCNSVLLQSQSLSVIPLRGTRPEATQV